MGEISNWRAPKHCTFFPIDCWHWKTRKFHGIWQDIGHPQSVCNRRAYPWSCWKTAYHQYQMSSSSNKYLLCLCTLYAYITRTAVVSKTHSDCVRVSAMQYACRTCILSMNFAAVGQQKILHLQEGFYSQDTCASWGLRSQTFTMNMHDQMEILMQLNLVVSDYRFQSTCWQEF
jgi:hypothetical protein